MVNANTELKLHKIKVKMERNCTTTPPHGMHKDSITFTPDIL